MQKVISLVLTLHFQGLALAQGFDYAAFYKDADTEYQNQTYTNVVSEDYVQVPVLPRVAKGIAIGVGLLVTSAAVLFANDCFYYVGHKLIPEAYVARSRVTGYFDFTERTTGSSSYKFNNFLANRLTLVCKFLSLLVGVKGDLFRRPMHPSNLVY
jgi:hypothetical protein